MQKRFGVNTSLVKPLTDSLTFNPLSIASLPLSLLYFIIGISSTSKTYGAEFSNGLCWVGIISIVILISVFINTLKENNATGASKSCSIASGISIGICVLNMVLDQSIDEDIKSISIIFLCIFILLSIIEFIYSVIKSKKKQIIIDNLNTCYLQLTEKNISGISFGDITATVDGSYFEIDYSDIRDVRTAADNHQYYNLFIDSKYGTYKISIDNSTLACDEIKRALSNGGILTEDLNSCEKDPGNISYIFCPNCNLKQPANRRFCFKCGFEFEQES